MPAGMSVVEQALLWKPFQAAKSSVSQCFDNLSSEGFLTNFKPMFHFYTPWKRQKTKDFLTFSGGMEMEHRLEIG